jgi:GH25 family lysozyme M1 (1,4-beta-N-acetylmuramidase)
VSLYTELQVQRAEVDRLAGLLADAKTKLAALEAQAVSGGPAVSQFQGDVDWPRVKGAGYEFAFVRTSDGDLRDPFYSDARVAAVRSAGLALSPYHFGRVASDGNAQRNGKSEACMALYFAESKGWGKAGDLPLAYDFEDLNGQTAAKAGLHLIEFIRTYKYVRGHWPIVYTAPAWFKPVGDTLSDEHKALLANCPLWIAHWGVQGPTVPAPWSEWTFWQWTDKGSSAGITGPVDLNRFAGTRDALTALRI